MLKRLLKDGAIYGFGALLARGVNILLLPLYTRLLSPEDFGISELAATLALLLGIVFPLEISQGLTRFFPSAKTEDEKTEYASTAVIYIMVICLIFVLISLPFAKPLSLYFLESDDQMLMVLALLNFFFLAIYNLSAQLLRCQFLALKFSIVNIVFSLVSIVGSIFTVAVLQIGIRGVLLGNLAGYIAGSGLALFFAHQNLVWRFNFKKLKEMLAFSAPLVPSALGYFATLYINRIMLKFMLTITDVGVYNIAYRIVSPVNLAVATFLSSVTPLVYEKYATESTPLEIARIFRMFFCTGLVLIITISVFSQEILFILTTKEFYNAATIVPVLTLSALLSGIYGFNYGLYIAKKTGLIALINIFSGLINILLNFLFIPMFGVIGAAWATCLSIFLNTFVSLWLGQKYYPIPFSTYKILTSSIIALTILWASSFITGTGILYIVAKSMLVIASIILFILIGLITFDEVKSFLVQARLLLFRK